MDQEEREFNLAELLKSLPRFHHSFSEEQEETASPRRQLDNVLESIITDDRTQFIRHLELLFRCQTSPNNDARAMETQCRSSSPDRKTVLDLLHSCCEFDSVECAAALLNGEVGVVPLVNGTDSRGRTPLHTAAEAHAPRCVELLLKKHARTDLRIKDGRRLLALDLSLCSSRMDVVWNPEEYSVEDLVVCLGQKDLTVVRLLSEKTKEIADVAYAQGMEGRVVSFATLLMVAPEKIKGSIMALRDADSGCKEKTTIYKSLIREALALGREETGPVRVAKRTCPLTKAECNEKRKLLLCEIELLQLSGVVSPYGCMDRKVISPLILAIQAGDETIIQLLLKTNFEINDADAEGNSALHWCVKTSKISSQQQMKILHLLRKSGAQVSQKNKLGLTAVHLAAAQGNLEALEVLIHEDLDSINSKTETGETPLFFAVKNDRMECADLLLRHGAITEVLNLRRQRPIDMAKSQDMRFMLNSSNIILMNRAPPIPQRCITLSEGDDSLPELKGEFNLMDEDTPTERGSTRHFANHEEELQPIQQGQSITPPEQKRKIFVGGLPPTLDSDSLGRIFEEHFGPVEDAIVIGYLTENQVHSRGFGLVVFKHEKSVSAALQVRYITICGKQVEIKRAVQYPRCPLPPLDLMKNIQNDEQELNDKTQRQAPASDGMKVDKPKSEQMSWVDRLLRGQPKVYTSDSHPPTTTCSKDKSTPSWLRIFRKWLPRLLQDLSRKGSEEHYPLSSLKGDFRAKFGMELDHASLGFLKLSEFMRSFPELCQLKVVPVGSPGPSNHMVLVPNLHKPLQPPKVSSTPSAANSIDRSSQGFSSELESPVTCIAEDNNMQDLVTGNSIEKHISNDINSKVLKCKPYELFCPQTTRVTDDERGASEGRLLLRLQKHLVLEALSRRRDSPYSFFLRDISFYMDYKSSVLRGCCFACKTRKMIWANFPCQHLLWCNDCKLEAVKAAGDSQHKCVICDRKVQRIDPIPSAENSRPSCRDLLNTSW
ncbi:uncharacterized protein LOC116194208 isoform X2 [Punica granatum]|uniref:Uncharacterized protein LOC116194208 isoform X2 n=1 Tax=Punica granatum TaxID=22663 RepID=A0A6P8CBC3_PUNGR|nr:uncharacterized protein LOC116194208 isoform X2 [Punica granatum]